MKLTLLEPHLLYWVKPNGKLLNTSLLYDTHPVNIIMICELSEGVCWKLKVSVHINSVK